MPPLSLTRAEAFLFAIFDLQFAISGGGVAVGKDGGEVEIEEEGYPEGEEDGEDEEEFGAGFEGDGVGRWGRGRAWRSRLSVAAVFLAHEFFGRTRGSPLL